MRVDFNGYKRLRRTGCNVDDRLVAFVGPNEAGKTSVLTGLAWLDRPGDAALPPSLASRGDDFGARADDDEIVRATFRLEASDWEALSDLSYQRDMQTRRYSYWRLRDGSRKHALSPRIRRDPAPFEKAIKSLGKAPAALESALLVNDAEVAEDESITSVRAQLARITLALNDPDSAVSASRSAEITSFAGWLRSLRPTSGATAIGQAADFVEAAGLALAQEHPNDRALTILSSRRPRFREFATADRDLESEFDTNQDAGSVTRALGRILQMASTDMDHLKEIWADEGARDTHLADCNAQLSEVFGKAWSQSDLSVHLKAEASLLKVQIKVVEGGRIYFSTFGERSDGLKAFVALVGFLNALPDQSPPILLIDEAETHLHLDAQADLIQVLQDRVQATQVFYTTHSPGCLPLDLGRGLRFVEPTDVHYSSEISHNFWDSKYPGFSAVLFKMGAAAFAFSALRNAVLAEGAGDMILLPTLIRIANDLDTLKYQIAPRLNDFDEALLRPDDVASHVAYLVDGDRGGKDKRRNLVKRRVREELIVSHASGFAVEDYVEPKQLLAIVNDLRTDPKVKLVSLPDLPSGETIGQRIDRWFSAANLEGPGKVAVATRLANLGDEILLRPAAKARLQRLHAEITAALDKRTEPNAL